jgi:hypothetical protein
MLAFTFFVLLLLAGPLALLLNDRPDLDDRSRNYSSWPGTRA